MAEPGRKGTTTGAMHRDGFVVAALVAWLGLIPVAAPSARAADSPANTLSDGDKKCLTCHASEGMTKNLGNGETLALRVHGEAFAKSVHAPLGCAICHAEINLDKHPGAQRKIETRRGYAVAMIEVCRTCHEDKFKLYEGSVHASLLRAGIPVAPVCTDCHSPHSIAPKAAGQPMKAVACRKCHETIFEAYAGSVHGLARGKSAESPAPLCAGCHRAHDVGAPSVGDRLRNTCIACHGGTIESHQSWLPNAERHLEVVSCPACHSPGAQRKVDLRLYDGVSRERMVEKKGVPQFEDRARSADKEGDGLDAIALRSLLKQFNVEGAERTTTLRGRLEVRTGVEAHQLSDKSRAVSNCDSCHREGADPFQSVTVSIVGADGRPLRHDAQKEVLNSAVSVESMRGFYAIGGTRIKLLDVLLVLALLSGILVPVGHMTVKWLFRRYLDQIAKQKSLENQTAEPARGGDTPGKQ
ncbi:MAG: cytochrome c3 family protein [Betaproteobacteria bacterium]|nr:cytochrome c3 family protein [Betaproteobacteria bacterium]